MVGWTEARLSRQAASRQLRAKDDSIVRRLLDFSEEMRVVLNDLFIEKRYVAITGVTDSAE